MECFVVFLMTLAVVTSFPLKKEEDSPLKRKILRPPLRRLVNEPHLNDPAPLGNWPWGVNVGWPNGGVNVGGGPNNNGGHGVGVNVGWPNGGVNVGAGHNSNGEHKVGVNVGWPNGGFNFGFGKRNIDPALNDPAEQSKRYYNIGNGGNNVGNYGGYGGNTNTNTGSYRGGYYGKRKTDPALNDPVEQSKRYYNIGNGGNNVGNYGGYGGNTNTNTGSYRGRYYGKRKIDPALNDPAEQSKRYYNIGNGGNNAGNYGGYGGNTNTNTGSYRGGYYGKRKIDPNVNDFREGDSQDPNDVGKN